MSQPQLDGRQAKKTNTTAETSSQNEQRPRSLRSWRSISSLGRSRTRSVSRTPDEDSHLHRLYSAGFLDDHGTYVGTHDDHEPRNANAANDANASEEPSSPESSGNDEGKKGLEEVEDDQDAFELDVEQQAEISNGGTLDLEKTPQDPALKRSQTNRSNRSQKDPNLVSWEGSDDPENPKNWKNSRKWAAVLVVSSFTFISPVSSSMVAPAFDAMDRDLGINDTVVSQMILSIFILAYAVGPLFLGPLSELYGRVPVLQLANGFFLIFNLVCGFAKTPAQMLVFRFFSGLGGSAPLAIGGGVLADCFHPEQRGKAIGIYSLAPLIGPAVGPIAGGFIAEKTTWRWVFWSISIADAVIQVFGLFFLQETWAPKLLEVKARKLRKETGNDKLYPELTQNISLWQKLRISLVRPFKLLFSQPTIQVCAVYMAYLYGLVYLVISTFPDLFTSAQYYDESVKIGGLHYIALAIGYFIGAQGTARFNDWLYRRLKRKNNGVGKPEFRIPAMIPCAILLPVGFFW
ncbi:MFS general substrate transporter [Teratosphaeria nubilosa]|uniref:MFS general substrate transporter n=1 Tax=Teratosphaeria nubilosa TaxID=161662 RepID=A0A6G1LBP3_9PEZI|nr:MFS general substrate transporter [Teratosphaeria nubilosa]